MNDTQQRAQRLAPDERRRAILEAVVPLLTARGAAVTSAEMASAAGVSEGTIFKVFPDKAALIAEAVRAALDADPVCGALAEIHPAASLEAKLAEAGRVLLERLDRAMALGEVLRSMPDRPADVRRFVAEANAAISAALAGLLDDHRDQLAIEPARAAVAFRGLIFACGNPLARPEDRLTVPEAVAVLVAGVTRAREMSR